MSTQFTLPLSLAENTIALSGGKGANLARLMQAGFPVPDGFVVTTEAYRAFIINNGLVEKILEQSGRIQPDDLAGLEGVSAELSAIFTQKPVPDEIVTQIHSAYQTLIQAAHERADTLESSANPAVAARSSATAEDLPGLAFAGQQETYLNLPDEPSLMEAVQKCWASLWTARAIAYRAHNHIRQNDLALAVVVQEMVSSEVSGVLFTANPVTGQRGEMVVDASYGLGEAVVSGQVDPDHFTITSSSWKITTRKLGAKQLAVRPRTGGGVEQVPSDRSRDQALSDTQIIALAQMADQVAAQFGAPQDIEWARADGRFYLLQARPITSLYPLPENSEPVKGLRVYANFNFIQGVTEPFTPLGLDVLRLFFGRVLRELRISRGPGEVFPEAGGRLFLDLTDLAGDPRLRGLALNLLTSTDPASGQTLLRLLKENRIPAAKVLTPRRVVTLAAALLPVLGSVLSAWIAPHQTVKRITGRGQRYLTGVAARINGAKDMAGLLDAMQADFATSEGSSIDVMPIALSTYNLLPLVNGWLTRWIGEKPGAALKLMHAFPVNFTLDMEVGLRSVARDITSDTDALAFMRSHNPAALAKAYLQGAMPEKARHALEGFLREYGQHAVAEIDLGRPRWREDPTALIQTVSGYLSQSENSLAPESGSAKRVEAVEHLAAEYVERTRKTRSGWIRATWLKFVFVRLRTLGGLRDAPLYYLVYALDLYRNALLVQARRLVDRGDLLQAEDIFFIPLQMLRHFADGEEVNLKEVAFAERAAFERERMRRQIPGILLSSGEAFMEGSDDHAAEGEKLNGEAVSPGTVEGRVRVILDPQDAHLEPGEILVCPATDPGWTPLFLVAGGLVMEIGGMITHGSVVAREYGLPAVAGIKRATTLLKTGELVRVDGSRGHVTRLPD